MPLLSGQLREWAAIAKDLVASAKDLLIGVSIAVLIGWLVIGGGFDKVRRVQVPGVGTIEMKEAADSAVTSLEKISGDLAKVKSGIDKSHVSFEEFLANRTDENLKKLGQSIEASKRQAGDATTDATESSRETAKAMARVDDVRTSIEQQAGALPTNPTVTGWYYLGKISRNRLTWLPSSARDNINFLPPLQANRNLIEQIELGKTQVVSSGYKYLRSTDSTSGKRLAGTIIRTLKPNTPVRIIELDANGADEGDTVIWALVEAPIGR
ncbi:MAG: hypothetical protein AAB403_13770 [Planctomycetota bacterium]